MKEVVFILFCIHFLYSIFNLYKNIQVTKKLEKKIEQAECLNDFSNILYEEE